MALADQVDVPVRGARQNAPRSVARHEPGGSEVGKAMIGPEECLARTVLFDGIDAADLKRLMSIARRKSLAEGEILFEQGDDVLFGDRRPAGEAEAAGQLRLVHLGVDGELVAEDGGFLLVDVDQPGQAGAVQPEKVEEVAVLPEPVGVVGIVHGAFIVAHQQDKAGVELRLQAVAALYVGIGIEHVLLVIELGSFLSGGNIVNCHEKNRLRGRGIAAKSRIRASYFFCRVTKLTFAGLTTAL